MIISRVLEKKDRNHKDGIKIKMDLLVWTLKIFLAKAKSHKKTARVTTSSQWHHWEIILLVIYEQHSH